jgi:hypothetical protein
MMTSHFLLLLLFAAFVSLVFAVLQRDTVEAQVWFGLRLFGGFVVAGVAIGWLMLLFPIG